MTLVYSSIVIQLSVFFIVAVSLNFVIGYAKSLSIHQAALFGVGAFTYAVFAGNDWTTDLVVCGIAGAAISGLLSVVLAFGAMRIAGDYFIVASFAFQIFAINALYNWPRVSGGDNGRYGLPPPSIPGYGLASTWSFIVLFGIVASAALAFAIWLRRSPYGRLLRAMGDSPSALQTAGFGILRLKVGVFGISGALAGLAGVLFASYIGAIDTTTFGIDLAILLVAMVIIGGTGSAVGSLLGAALIAFAPPLISNLPLGSTTAAAVQQLIFAGLLIIVVAALPRGLVQLGDRPKLALRRWTREVGR